MKRYLFEEPTHCEMCGDSTRRHRVLGQRLDKSQGLSPRTRRGISVSVMRCTNCELIYSFPTPIPMDLQDHYGSPAEEYWKPEYFQWTPDYFSDQIQRAKELLPYAPGMRALDVGAGIGKAMLSLDVAGFEAHGFEPSIPFYDKAISEMSVRSDRLRLGAVEDVDYAPESFNFITFGAVFEHLYHPAQCLERALRWLKPGGLVHIEVPSSRHLIARLLNAYYRMRGTNYVTHLSPMHPPFHLYEFGLRSFEILARKLGCSVVDHRFDPCSIMFLPRVTHPLLRAIMRRTDTGMQLTVYVRKH